MKEQSEMRVDNMLSCNEKATLLIVVQSSSVLGFVVRGALCDLRNELTLSGNCG